MHPRRLGAHRAITRGAALVSAAAPAALLPISSAFAQYGPPQLDTVIVTATRFPEDRLDAPVGMTVITAEEIAKSTARTLPELLGQQGNIVTRNTTGSPDQQVDLRGFGITGDQNTLILLDGRRLDEVDLSTPSWSSIPLESIQRIEIMRGSGSVLYGGGATGGTINIITKTPQRATVTGNAMVGGGSYGTFQAGATGSAAGEMFGATGSVNSYQTDNWRDNNRVQQWSGQGDLRAFGSAGRLDFSFGGDRQSVRLPGPRTQLELLLNPRGTSTPQDWAQREGARALLTGEVALGGGTLAADVGYRQTDRNAFLGDYFSAGLFNTYVQSTNGVWTFTPRFKLPYRAFGARNTLVVGYDYDRWNYERQDSRSQTSLPFADLQADQTSNGAYLQNYSVFSTGTRVTLGGRLQWVDTTATDFANVLGPTSASKSLTPHAYEIGVRQPLSDTLEIYSRYGQSFRIPRVDEIYDQFGGPGFTSRIVPLDAQLSHVFEVGMEYRSNTLRARASAYEMNLSNEIFFFVPTGQNINLPPTQRKGIEVDASWQVLPELRLFGNLALRTATFKQGMIGPVNVTGNTIPLVPETLFTVGAAWNVTGQTLLSAVVNYVGTQYYDNDVANDFGRKMPAYTVVDLKLAQGWRGWTFTAAVNNLFDEFYYSYAVRSLFVNTFNAYPNLPRTFLATAEYRFK
jgi:iron complex outermembrane recepter protein